MHFISRSETSSITPVDEWGKGEDLYFVGVQAKSSYDTATSKRSAPITGLPQANPAIFYSAFLKETKQVMGSLESYSNFLKLARVISHLLVIFSFSIFVEGVFIWERIAICLLGIALYIASQCARRKLQHLKRCLLRQAEECKQM